MSVTPTKAVNETEQTTKRTRKVPDMNAIHEKARTAEADLQISRGQDFLSAATDFYMAVVERDHKSPFELLASDEERLTWLREAANAARAAANSFENAMFRLSDKDLVEIEAPF